MIFIAGNIPMVSEIAPLLIVTKLEQYDYRVLRRSRPSCWSHRSRCCSRSTRCRRGRPATVARRDELRSTRDASGGVAWPASPSRAEWERRLLIAAAMAFVGAVPRAAAGIRTRRRAANGVAAYVAALADPDALAALRLTLASSRSRCRATAPSASRPHGRSPGSTSAGRAARHADRLPLSVSPVIAGLICVLVFGQRGMARATLEALDVQVISPCLASRSRRRSSRCRSSRAS